MPAYQWATLSPGLLLWDKVSSSFPIWSWIYNPPVIDSQIAEWNYRSVPPGQAKNVFLQLGLYANRWIKLSHNGHIQMMEQTSNDSEHTNCFPIFFFKVYWDGGGGPHYITSAGLGLIMYTRLTSTKRCLPTSALWVLRLKACITMPILHF